MAYVDTPLANENLDVSQGLIRGNFLQANASFAINHYAFSDVSGQSGKHHSVVMPNRALFSVPTAVQEGALYTSFQGGITRLVFTRDGGNDQFIGGPISVLPIGYTSIGGTLLLQWGFVNSTTSGNVTFPIAFTTQCFIVQTTPYRGGAVPNSQANAIVQNAGGSPSTTGFHWDFFTNSGSYTGFYWMAIGS